MLLLVIAGGILYPACKRPGGKRVIAVIPKGVSHFFWQTVHAGAESAAKEFNVDVAWNGPASETDYSGQINIVEDAINRHVFWTDPVIKFASLSPTPRRIVGIAADVDDENVVPGPAMSVYHPIDQAPFWGGRLFVHTRGNPYALVQPVTRVIRDMSADQPVERAATLEDVRAEVLTPDRLNTLVFGGFAAVALAIAVVGVAGVLAFSVSARTREFGIRLAIGSQPWRVLRGVVSEGALMAGAGIFAGGLGGYALATVASSYFDAVRMPGAMPVAGSVVVLLAAAVAASAVPALRAAQVDVMQALRSD